jgi:hypothetical protein
MLSLFKRLRQPCEQSHEPDSKVRTAQHDRPGLSADNRSKDAEELTPASWPPVETNTYGVMWNGGCCG